MKVNFIFLSVFVFGFVFSFTSLGTATEAVDLETFEALSVSIKNKQVVSLQDESPLKIILQYSQPQRKIQTNSELSEASLSAE